MVTPLNPAARPLVNPIPDIPPPPPPPSASEREVIRVRVPDACCLCRWYSVMGPAQGLCRALPPTPVMTDGRQDNLFPVVDYDNSCSLFQADEPVTEGV